MSFVYTSKTDKDFIVDVVAPGYGKEDVAVLTYREGGEGPDGIDMIRVKGEYVRPTGETGKLVPRFAWDKCVPEKIKLDVAVPEKFNVNGLKWSMKNGVLRIRVPLHAWAVGKKVEPVENVEGAPGDADAEE